jgi:hypothetical protein
LLERGFSAHKLFTSFALSLQIDYFDECHASEMCSVCQNLNESGLALSFIVFTGSNAISTIVAKRVYFSFHWIQTKLASLNAFKTFAAANTPFFIHNRPEFTVHLYCLIKYRAAAEYR